jgi:hypothetical protein
MSRRTLEELAALLERGGEPDDVLRAAVATLAARPEIAWAGVAFLEEEKLVVGPSAGIPDEARRQRVRVDYEGAQVGELWVDGGADPAFLQRAADLLATHVLIGWDTGGRGWEP